MIEVENLKPEETYKFIANAFRDGELQSTGTAFAAILMPVNMFIKRITCQKKSTVLKKLRAIQ
jgi:type I restriction enzyme R subunit